MSEIAWVFVGLRAGFTLQVYLFILQVMDALLQRNKQHILQRICVCAAECRCYYWSLFLQEAKTEQCVDCGDSVNR